MKNYHKILWRDRKFIYKLIKKALESIWWKEIYFEFIIYEKKYVLKYTLYGYNENINHFKEEEKYEYKRNYV